MSWSALHWTLRRCNSIPEGLGWTACANDANASAGVTFTPCRGRGDFSSIEKKDRQNKVQFHQRFDDPQTAHEILLPRLFDLDPKLSLTTSVIDNATVDYAFNYFTSVAYRNDVRVRRFTLLSAAEVINALILSDSILTGPNTGPGVLYDRRSMVGIARALIHPIHDRLTPAEIFAVVSLSKHETIRILKDRGFDVSCLSLSRRETLSRAAILKCVEQITPKESDHSPHHLVDIVDEPDYYYHDFAAGVIGPTGGDLGIVDYEDAAARRGTSLYGDVYDGDRQWKYMKRDSDPYPMEELHEYFAARILFRAQVYMLLSDMLGAPYIADPVRSPIVRVLGRRASFSASSFIVDELEKTERSRTQNLNNLLGFGAFTARVPLVVRHVLHLASNREELLEITMDMRDSTHARRFRQYCANVDQAIAAGNVKAVERALSDLTAAGIRLDEGLSKGGSLANSMFDASKEVVSLASPALGALVPGLKMAADLIPKLTARFRLAMLHDLRNTPRTLGEMEREFEAVWPPNG